MKALTCICCGAPINRAKKKCEYCGTEYEIKDDTPMIRFETFHNPVREYSAACVLRREELALARNPQEYMEWSIKRLAQAMVPAIVSGMRIKVEDDPSNLMDKRIIGSLKVVIPEKMEDQV